MVNEIKIVQEHLSEMNPHNTVILSHADHDGFTSSVLFNLYFKKQYGSTAFVMYPYKNLPYYKIFYGILRKRPKYLLILDALVHKHKKFLEKISKKTLIINMDHHDNVVINSENYINLNPHNWGLEYLNSSGLAWLVLRDYDTKFFDERSWVAGIGAIQDYCIDDNKLLFRKLKEMGYISELDFRLLINSRLMKIAKLINIGISNVGPREIYDKIFSAAEKNNIYFLERDKVLLEVWSDYTRRFKDIYLRYKNERIIKNNLIAFNLKNEPIFLISEICEREKEEKIYMGYSKGLLGFRALFYNYDVRRLAILFNGGGPHPKVAGGKTTKSFEEVVSIITRYLLSEKSQKSLGDFYDEK